MDEKKTKAQKLEEKLLHTKKSGCKSYAKIIDKKLDSYIKGYIDFMNAAKTEREFTDLTVSLLEKNGFKPLDRDKKYQKGDKIYFNNRNRSLIAAVIGAAPLSQGVHIVAGHIDVPRLDLKPHPLYENSELCYFKTHYYGGIKKYQWVALPLAIHGVVVKKDGQTVRIVIGEDENDPVLCITDVLPHLSANVQDKRTAREVIKGEELNILLGSEPIDDEKIKEPVKLNIMRLLHEKYGIYESDFVSADLSVVPALKARYVGLDKSMVGAYGHDDRVCSYAGIMALIDTPKPANTTICILADKEEIGSVGNTGLESDMLRSFLSTLARSCGASPEELLYNSDCLSADVNAAFDPNFGDIHESRNAAYLNYGPALTKYTGAFGKVATNDASAELIGKIRRIFDDAGVPWQTGELGKVDEGGGGTVAKFIARLGIDVVDIGVPLLSMHAPFEIASCVDIYAMYAAFCAYYQ